MIPCIKEVHVLIKVISKQKVSKKNVIRSKPAVKLESVISPLQRRRRRRRRESNLSHSESVLVAGEHVEVGPGLARVAVARLARQRHHSETGWKKGQRKEAEREGEKYQNIISIP